MSRGEIDIARVGVGWGADGARGRRGGGAPINADATQPNRHGIGRRPAGSGGSAFRSALDGAADERPTGKQRRETRDLAPASGGAAGGGSLRPPTPTPGAVARGGAPASGGGGPGARD